jgi:membrane associated rhomboid family serine protease
LSVARQRAAGSTREPLRGARQKQGIRLLLVIAAVMWAVEVINSLDGNALDADGIYPRNLDRLWGILTAPFLHASFAHLLSNTIPFLFMGLIIALRGALRLVLVSAIVIVLGGVGTWLIAPAGTVTIGASGLVFGYATYLLTRGLFDHSALELLTAAAVAAVWGGALVASLVPHDGISWQGHLCGAVAGTLAAWLLARPGAWRKAARDGTGGGAGSGRAGGRKTIAAPPRRDERIRGTRAK